MNLIHKQQRFLKNHQGAQLDFLKVALSLLIEFEESLKMLRLICLREVD